MIWGEAGVRWGVKACPDGLGHFLSMSKGAISCFRGGGTERLLGWFVNFLAQFGNVKKQASKGTLLQISTLYI